MGQKRQEAFLVGAYHVEHASDEICLEEQWMVLWVILREGCLHDDTEDVWIREDD